LPRLGRNNIGAPNAASCSTRAEKNASGFNEPARSQLDQVCEDAIEVTFAAGV
jgi:hypothetical protein